MYRAVHAWRPPHIVESRCSGVRFRYSSQSHIGEAIYANAFEREERSLLDRILSPGLTILDVGANLGFYTCLFARKVGPTGRVIAFEPTPSTFELLEQNVRLNGLHDIVECRSCGLSDKEGIARMNLFSEGKDVYNSFRVDDACDKDSLPCVIDVTTTTLDQCLETLDAKKGCFIKIDVEGFEHQVIMGGRNQLQRLDNLSLMIELYEPLARRCGSSTLQTVEVLESCGFKAYWMNGHGTLAPVDARARGDLEKAKLPPDVFFFKPATRPHWID